MEVRNVSYLQKQHGMTLLEIGEIVRKARSEKGLSQKQLAELAGVDQPAISRIENGQRGPGIDAQTKVATALGVEWCLSIPI